MIKSKFSYFPLVWMFCSRTPNNGINKVHERALRIALDNNIESFLELLGKSQVVTNHQQNIWILMTELFKVVNNLLCPIMHNFVAAVN